MVLGVIFKNFSPTVDVNIGQNDIHSEEIVGDSEIDDRLKWIQDEDNQEPTSEKYLKAETDNLISKIKPQKDEKKETIRPKNNVINDTSNLQQEEIPLPVNTKYITVPPVPTVKEVQQIKPAPSTKVTKVYIGFYKNLDDAMFARAKITQAFPGIQPFVKAVNGQYIVQAGSFADRRKAVELKEELDNRGYTARLLSD